jgi:6-phosphogluconolactonase (cycloisomerase 2 family)
MLLVGCGGGVGSISTVGVIPGSGGAPGGTGSGSGTSGNGGGPSASGAIVYVAGNTNSAAAFIEARMVDAASGMLTPIPGSPFSIGHSRANDIALSTNGQFAYVIVSDFPGGTCCVGPTSMAVFALDPNTGAPAATQTVSVPSNATLKRVFVHPSGNLVYASYVDFSASFGSGFAIFAVQSDGTLAFKSLTPAQNSGGSVFDSNGVFVYTDQDGGHASAWGNAPCGPIFSNVFGYSIDPATGALTPIAGNPFTFQRNICEVGHAPSYLTEQIDPAGTRLFLVDTSNQSITEFSIDGTSGALTALATTTTTTGVSGYSSSAMDTKGRFLYVGSTVDSFTGFSLASASAPLPMLPGMPVHAFPLPNFNEGSTAAAVDPSGTFLFSNENEFTSAFSCCDPDALVGFRIDPATGSLTQVPAMPRLLGTAAGIAIRAR